MVHIKDFRMENGEPQFEHIGDGLFHYEPLLRWLKKRSHILPCFWKIPTGSGGTEMCISAKIYEEV
mgnify:CR=1 FL=1